MTDKLRDLSDDVKNRIKSVSRHDLICYLAIDMPEVALDLAYLTPSQYSQRIKEIIEYDTKSLRREDENDRAQLEDLERILLFLANNGRP
jgi:hypothetical protein